MSVSKKDLERQNERLAAIAQELEKENSKLNRQARTRIKEEIDKIQDALAGVDSQARKVRVKAEVGGVVRPILLSVLAVSSAIAVVNTTGITYPQLAGASLAAYLLFEIAVYLLA
jgi:multidrug resistance efflux pump